MTSSTLLLTLCLPCLVVAACNEMAEEPQPKGRTATLFSVTADDADKYHNDGVAFLNEIAFWSQTYLDSAARANAVIFKLDSFYVSYIDGWDWDTAAVSEWRDSLTAMFVNRSYDDPLDWMTIAMAYAEVPLYVATLERSYVDDVIDAVSPTFPPSTTRATAYDSIEARLDRLRQDMDTVTDWGTYSDGGMSIGAARAALGSLDIMIELDPNANEPFDPPVLSVLQADLAGYVVGWVWAVISDSHQPGGVQRSGEARRIRRAVKAAVSASTGLPLVWD